MDWATVWWKLHDPNVNCFDWSTRVSDRQTEWRQHIAHSAYMLSRAKNVRVSIWLSRRKRCAVKLLTCISNTCEQVVSSSVWLIAYIDDLYERRIRRLHRLFTTRLHRGYTNAQQTADSLRIFAGKPWLRYELELSIRVAYDFSVKEANKLIPCVSGRITGMIVYLGHRDAVR